MKNWLFLMLVSAFANAMAPQVEIRNATDITSPEILMQAILNAGIREGRVHPGAIQMAIQKFSTEQLNTKYPITIEQKNVTATPLQLIAWKYPGAFLTEVASELFQKNASPLIPFTEVPFTNKGNFITGVLLYDNISNNAFNAKAIIETIIAKNQYTQELADDALRSVLLNTDSPKEYKENIIQWLFSKERKPNPAIIIKDGKNALALAQEYGLDKATIALLQKEEIGQGQNNSIVPLIQLLNGDLSGNIKLRESFKKQLNALSVNDINALTANVNLLLGPKHGSKNVSLLEYAFYKRNFAGVFEILEKKGVTIPPYLFEPVDKYSTLGWVASLDIDQPNILEKVYDATKDQITDNYKNLALLDTIKKNKSRSIAYLLSKNISPKNTIAGTSIFLEAIKEKNLDIINTLARAMYPQNTFKAFTDKYSLKVGTETKQVTPLEYAVFLSSRDDTDTYDPIVLELAKNFPQLPAMEVFGPQIGIFPWLAQFNKLELMDQLLAQNPARISGDDKAMALFIAAGRSRDNVVIPLASWLLQRGANPNMSIEGQSLPLTNAINKYQNLQGPRENVIAFVQLLLNRGANPDLVDPFTNLSARILVEQKNKDTGGAFQPLLDAIGAPTAQPMQPSLNELVQQLISLKQRLLSLQLAVTGF